MPRGCTFILTSTSRPAGGYPCSEATLEGRWQTKSKADATLVSKHMTNTETKRKVFPVIAKSIFCRTIETPRMPLV